MKKVLSILLVLAVMGFPAQLLASADIMPAIYASSIDKTTGMTPIEISISITTDEFVRAIKVNDGISYELAGSISSSIDADNRKQFTLVATVSTPFQGELFVYIKTGSNEWLKTEISFEVNYTAAAIAGSQQINTLNNADQTSQPSNNQNCPGKESRSLREFTQTPQGLYRASASIPDIWISTSAVDYFDYIGSQKDYSYIKLIPPSGALSVGLTLFRDEEQGIEYRYEAISNDLVGAFCANLGEELSSNKENLRFFIDDSSCSAIITFSDEIELNFSLLVTISNYHEEHANQFLVDRIKLETSRIMEEAQIVWLDHPWSENVYRDVTLIDHKNPKVIASIDTSSMVINYAPCTHLQATLKSDGAIFEFDIRFDKPFTDAELQSEGLKLKSRTLNNDMVYKYITDSENQPTVAWMPIMSSGECISNISVWLTAYWGPDMSEDILVKFWDYIYSHIAI